MPVFCAYSKSDLVSYSFLLAFFSINRGSAVWEVRLWLLNCYNTVLIESAPFVLVKEKYEREVESKNFSS
jgi:hypothetical protein